MKKFDIDITSPPDRENLVAEIFYDNIQWVEISQKTEELVIQFYAHPEQGCWEFSCNEALEALNQAKERLLGMGGIKT
jgi:hypothetical protein